jgi:rhodanese-related sulfurtransferase
LVGAADGTDTLDVDPARVVSWLSEERAPQLIDVREPYEREAGHIAGSTHVELTQLPATAAGLDRERALVFYCRTGSRSLMAAQAFRTSGFEAYSMGGGLMRWVAEGHPLSPQGGHVADH